MGRGEKWAPLTSIMLFNVQLSLSLTMYSSTPLRNFSPFATLAALFDGVNHFLLMISFRLGPAPALFHLSKMDATFHPQQYLFASATLVASLSVSGMISLLFRSSPWCTKTNLNILLLLFIVFRNESISCKRCQIQIVRKSLLVGFFFILESS